MIYMITIIYQDQQFAKMIFHSWLDDMMDWDDMMDAWDDMMDR